jgi:hypothetical protein
LGRISFSPVFRLFATPYWEILDPKLPQFISFHPGFVGFSGSTNYCAESVGNADPSLRSG